MEKDSELYERCIMQVVLDQIYWEKGFLKYLELAFHLEVDI